MPVKIKIYSFILIFSIIFINLNLLLAQNVANDTLNIDKLNNLAYELNYSNTDQAQKNAEEALSKSKDLNYIKGIATAYSMLAIISKNLGKYEQALSLCDSSEYYLDFINDSVAYAGIYNTRGTINYYKSNYRIALKWYAKSYKLYHSQGLLAREAVLLNNLGLAYSELSNYKTALKYYFDALKLHEKSNNKNGEALTFSNIGIVYFNLGSLDKAMEFYEKSLNIRLKIDDDFGIASCYTNIGNILIIKKEFSKALEYNQKALKIFKDKNDVHNLANTYQQIGYYFLTIDDYQNSIIYYKKALEIGTKINSKNLIAHSCLNIGVSLMKLGKYNEVYDYLNLSREKFEKIGDLNMLKYSYQSLSEYYENIKNNKKSLEYYKKYSLLNDSMITIESSKRITESELLFESQKKENEINILTKEKELNKLKFEKTNQFKRMLIILVIIAVLFAIILLWRFIEKIRSNKLLHEINVSLEDKSIQIKQQNQKIEEQFVKLKELDETKSRFFANISHEFRTPLTLILGPVQDVIKFEKEKLSENTFYNLKIAHKNINHLKSLIDQILDLAKLKSGKLGLKTSKLNIVSFLEKIVSSFNSAISERMKIDVRFLNNNENIYIYFDRQKLETIFMNLLSNAVKYIPNDGTILVEILNESSADTVENFIRIKVADSGIGISRNDLPNIFNRFYRAGNSSLSNIEGTGIGLELTKELIELHGGQISVESELGKGTTFFIDLPLGKEHLSKDEIVKIGENEINSHFSLETTIPEISTSKTESLENHTAKHSILLVEDNKDMRNYIISHLKNDYIINEAENGEIGYVKAVELKPDLIVSDLMMPITDGLELLNLVRENRSIEDTPFILLTARADDEDKISGFKAKADDYIVKPFNSEELVLRIQNLLDTRTKLKEKFSSTVLSIEFDNDTFIPADQQFLEKMRDAVIENIAQSEFGVKQLAEKAFLSERQLRRRITELTSLGPIEFIRQIKLLKAKELIQNKVYFSISEVSAAVGFNNPHYFSRLFKNMFEKSPTEINNIIS